MIKIILLYIWTCSDVIDMVPVINSFVIQSAPVAISMHLQYILVSDGRKKQTVNYMLHLSSLYIGNSRNLGHLVKPFDPG